MKFTLITLFAGAAFATYDAAPSSSSAAAASSSVSYVAKPTGAPLYSAKPETCETYTETCTVTVTAPRQAWGTANSTVAASHPVAAGTGTGSPVQPTKAYYSNAANSMAGGAFVAGAGALAALLF